MQPALRKTIAEIYGAFEKYKPNKKIHACKCCFNENDNALLLSKPLHEIPASYFTAYSGATDITGGDQRDYKHFLPRVLELASVFEHSHYGVETDFVKIGEASYRSWPENESALITKFLTEYWKYILSLPYDFGKELESEDYLCAISRAGFDINELLETWQNTENELADKYLVDLRFSIKPNGKLSKQFWAEEQENIVISWLKEEMTVERIKRVLSEHPGLNEFGVII